MTSPIEFTFKRDNGETVTVKADAYTAGDPSVGLFGPYYEEVWAEDADGRQLELTEPESDRAFMEAAERASEWDWEP